MSTQSSDEIKYLIGKAELKYRELVTDNVIKSLQLSFCNIVLKIETFYYEDGTRKKLPCLYGTIASAFKGKRYNTPIEIWLEKDSPVSPPKVYVKPTSDMHISTTAPDIQPDGVVTIAYLKSWHHPITDLPTLIFEISKSFSKSSPVFANVLSATPKSTSVTNSNNGNEQKHIHRFSDIVAEPRQMLLPIQGYEHMPIVSLEEAIKPIHSLVQDIEHMVWIVKQNCTDPKDGLNSDESAAIMLYTMEWEPYHKSFYVALNAALRAVKRDELRPWFSYLRLVIHALQKLPSTHRIMYRGIKTDLADQYARGDKIVWWGFSSCTLSIETLQSEKFLGKKGTRTLFSIECQSGKNIRAHSFYSDDDEVLLFPARQFEVIGCLDQGNGLKLVQLRETQPEFPLIKPLLLL